MPKRKLPPNDVLKQMYESGLNAREIAIKLNANLNTVASSLKNIPDLMRSNSEAQKLSFKKGRKAPTYWKGKKQPIEMVEKRVSKIRGKNHYLWKGGDSRRPYRDVINKIRCAECGSKLNLGIHHIDLDHYNDAPKNLQVLCVSCHITLHKKLYWKAKREGTEYKNNSPIGWNK